MIPVVFLLLLFLHWDAVSTQGICVDQPEGIQVNEGDNVSLPCKFTFPRDLNPQQELKVSWRFSKGPGCRNHIYSQSSGSSSRTSGGHIALIRESVEAQSAELFIPQVTMADHDRYCCKVGIVTQHRMDRVWESGAGTELRVQDASAFHVHQPDLLLPLEGDSVTIPCTFSYPADMDPVLEVNVLWRAGEEDFCGDFIYSHLEGFILQSYIDRISLVGDPMGGRSGSIRIDDIQVSDSKKYCCRVQMRTRNGTLSVWQNRFGTRLQVGVFMDRVQRPGYLVTQPAEVSVFQGESANLTCTFTYHRDPREMDPIWTGFYWRARNVWGNYLYHPNPELIHHLYRGRTQMVDMVGMEGTTTLWLDSVNNMDSQNYFCLVAFRFCGDKRIFVTETQQGTKLMVRVAEIHLEPEIVTKGTTAAATTTTTAATTVPETTENEFHTSPGSFPIIGQERAQFFFNRLPFGAN